MDPEITRRLKSIDSKMVQLKEAKSVSFAVDFKSICENDQDTSRFKFNITPAIELDSYNYEIALLNIETYYSFPNITNGVNSELRYSNGTTSNVISLPTGSYEIDAINDEIKRQLETNGDNKDAITISANTATLTSIIALTNSYQVDFTYPNSINTLLGFGSVILSNAYNISPNIVKILKINSIYVQTDIITDSYINGASAPVIYSFFPNVSPGDKIVQSPINLVYLPVNRKVLDSMTVWITDQNGDIINFRGESISIRFHLKKISYK